MKRKGRTSSSKAEEKSENGVEDPKETNGDVAEEPEEKKRKSGGRNRQSKKDENKSKNDEEEENEESDENEENESEKKKKKKASGKNTKKTDESVEENTDEDDNSGAKKKKKSSVKGKGNKKNGKSNDKDNEEDSSVDEEKKVKGKKPKDEDTKEEEEEEDDAEYEVEKIVDEKVVRGVKHYLIRWKGYSSDTDTWEPVDTLDCPNLIAEFKKGRKKKKKFEKGTTKKEESWDENEDFEVDKVLDVHFRRDGKREFLVSWKGYPQSQSSWEPEENMNCIDLIERFMLKVEKAKETNDKELRVNRKHTDRFTLTMGQAGRRLSKRQTGKQRVQYHEIE